MTCIKCKRPFVDMDMVMGTIISVYHELNKPGMDDFKFAVERPHAVRGLRHLCCPEFEADE